MTGKGWLHSMAVWISSTINMAEQAFLGQFHFRWIYFSVGLLLVYRKAAGFCTLIWYMAALMKVVIRSQPYCEVYE